MANNASSNEALFAYRQCYFQGAHADFTNDFAKAYITVVAFNCLACLPTIFGNVLITLGIWLTPSLHTPSNMILVGLACSDLGVGLIVPALNIARIVSKLNGAHFNSWCTVQVAYTFFGVTFCGVSFLTVAALSIDKYLALHWHLRYAGIVTTKRIIYTLVSFWFVFAAMSTVQIWSMTLYRVSVCLILAVFLVGTSFTYFRIYRVLRRHKIQIKSQHQVQERDAGFTLNMARYRKSVTSMFLVYCLFLVCYLPYIIVQTAILVTELRLFSDPSIHSSLSVWGEVVETLVILNSLTNPAIYCWRMRDIRRAASLAMNVLTRCKSAEHLHTERSVHTSNAFTFKQSIGV
ncbi:trace amine-associated receptor 9-like [Nematostella vectensis]|uniref:trace amine-associated receptor 9-like n=1 Tax=Nematostella vectensis TaxID=45351 RepID=UPI0020777048|nr:trace amine-associated receptor 9-like [Nematostella vectensis]